MSFIRELTRYYSDYKSILLESFALAFNRSATQIATIIITSLLGLTSTQILAEFSLALSFAAILFPVVTTFQFGLQAEFARKFAAHEWRALKDWFVWTLIVILILSFFLIFYIWGIEPKISTISAESTLKVLVLSLPLVGILTTISYFLESIGEIEAVARLRLSQIILQVGLVLTFILIQKGFFDYELSAPNIATIYVITDLIVLLIGIRVLKIKIKFPFLKSFRMSYKLPDVIQVLKLGAPMMLGMMGQKAVFFLYANAAAGLGFIYASCFSIINSMVFFTQIPLLGIAHLLTIKIAQNIGERNGNKLKQNIVIYAQLFLFELLFLILCFNLFKPWIINVFTKDPAVLDLIHSIPSSFILFFIMNALLTFSMSILRGFSDTFLPQFILISSLSLGAWFYYFLGEGKHFSEILICFSTSGIVAAVFLLSRAVVLQKASSQDETDSKKS